MISIYKLTKQFGKLRALNEVSLDFTLGKSYALIGPNGSGKTTLIKSVLGMVIPTTGKIEVDGANIKNSWLYREKIGYMPQIGHYPENMRIGQLFDMVRNIRKDPPLLDEELMEAFALTAIQDKRMHTLSGGTRQKVSAALAFLFNPPVLILDEPTAGLDPVSVEILKEKIQQEKDKGKLLIITSHIMNDLDELATEVVYLHEGNVRYNNSIAELKDITGETRLGKAIAQMIRSLEKKVIPEAINLK
ncbi:MAG TPA: ABC transporter ATP-binding protein [Cyclobacteriaceae bacterium]|nr:ABC transporter ATP-binding protein [Cyclobacteriaceae bacterium]HRJ82850.1 ABC transporter ATP-binding protein [Cyclobacteriaceae bacterium]